MKQIVGKPVGDLIGQPFGSEMLGCDGGPASVIKALEVTAFCPVALRSNHEAIVAYGKDAKGLFAQLRDESAQGLKEHHCHLEEIGPDRKPPAEFCAICKAWGIGALELAQFVLDNAPKSESHG